MERLAGSETEYGLYVGGVDVADLTSEARTLLKCGPPGAKWDYRDESPKRDLRGFSASRLRTNPEDDEIERRSRAPRPRSREEEHADRVLTNGARLYHDHGHPEYSTPECRSLADLLAHDRAGMRVVRECARRHEERSGKSVQIYKNNTDYHQMSYGCHENYLVRRDLPFERLVAGLLPFLVTRVLYTGAGKVGVEKGYGPGQRAVEGELVYQLSQRADFFNELMSVDTLFRRPLINTRDEPHADPRRWVRLHVILGDANLSETATALKVGTTALVLDVLEAGYGPPGELKSPVDAIKRLSLGGAASVRRPLELADRSTVPAIEIQRAYLRAAEELAAGRDEETDWVLREWAKVLDDLETDLRGTRDRVDWVAKQELLRSFVESEGLKWAEEEELLRSLELDYHGLDPEGLFWTLERQGAMRRLTEDEDIERAARTPPRDTRAHVRGHCLRHFEVVTASWSRLRVRYRGQVREVDLRRAVSGDVERLEPLPGEAGYEDVLEWVAQASLNTDIP